MTKNDLTFGASLISVLVTFSAAIFSEIAHPAMLASPAVSAWAAHPAASAPAHERTVLAQARRDCTDVAER